MRNKYSYHDPKLQNEYPTGQASVVGEWFNWAGRLRQLYWYKYVERKGKTFGYLVNGPKCWLIPKLRLLANDAKQIFGEEINVTTEGKRHLGGCNRI